MMQHEIETLNTEDFKRTCNWLQMLTQLIEEQQDSTLPNAAVSLAQWEIECEELRYSIWSRMQRNHFLISQHPV